MISMEIVDFLCNKNVVVISYKCNRVQVCDDISLGNRPCSLIAQLVDNPPLNQKAFVSSPNRGKIFSQPVTFGAPRQ